MVKKFRETLALLWKDRCTISIREAYEQENGATAFRERTLHEDISCKLSFFLTTANNAAAGESGAAAGIEQQAKLILAPDIEIPPGCSIRVQREGKAMAYKASGPPLAFFSHQEIIMRLDDEWA